MTSTIEICDLGHAYGGQETVLEDVNLQVHAGEIISILGPSGCGKTTLLRIIAGLEKHSKGTVKINDRIVSSQNFSLPPEQRNIDLSKSITATSGNASTIPQTTTTIRGVLSVMNTSRCFTS